MTRGLEPGRLPRLSAFRASSRPDAGPSADETSSGAGPFETGPGGEIAPTCQVVWGGEPLWTTDGNWVDAARAAAFVGSEPVGSVEGRRTVVVVLGLRLVERHAIIEAPNGSFAGLIREGSWSAPIDPEASIDLARFLEAEIGSRIVMVAKPSLDEARRREWAAVASRLGVEFLDPDSLVRAFAQACPRPESGQGEVSYRLAFCRSAWGTSVSQTATIRATGPRVSRSFRIAGHRLGDFRLDFRVQERSNDGPWGRSTEIASDPFPSSIGRSPRLEFDACSTFGSHRWVLREGSESSVRWPVLASARAARTLHPTASIVACVALDERGAARAWRRVWPLLARLIESGRLSRLQVVWSGSGTSKTRGWGPEGLATAWRSLEADPPDPNAADSMVTRGLSEALREALIASRASPLAGLVLLDRDYEPEGDPTFRSIEGRWAWTLRMRRELSGPFALVGYEVDPTAGRPDPDGRRALEHLILLGRQARLAENLLPALPEGVDVLDSEVAALLEVLELGTPRVDEDGPRSARVLALEEAHPIPPESGR